MAHEHNRACFLRRAPGARHDARPALWCRPGRGAAPPLQPRPPPAAARAVLQAGDAAAEVVTKNGGFFGGFATAFEQFLKVLDDGFEKVGVPYRCAQSRATDQSVESMKLSVAHGPLGARCMGACRRPLTGVAAFEQQQRACGRTYSKQ